MRSGSERMHTWRRTPSTGRNFQTLIMWITVSWKASCNGSELRTCKSNTLKKLQIFHNKIRTCCWINKGYAILILFKNKLIRNLFIVVLVGWLLHFNVNKKRNVNINVILRSVHVTFIVAEKIYFSYFECVSVGLVIQYVMRMRHIVTCALLRSKIFFHIIS